MIKDANQDDRSSSAHMTTLKLDSWDMKDVSDLPYKVRLWDSVGLATTGSDNPMTELIAQIKHEFGVREGDERPKTLLWGVLVVVSSETMNLGKMGFQFVKQLIDAGMLGSMKNAIRVATHWDQRNREQKELFETEVVPGFFRAPGQVGDVHVNWAKTCFSEWNQDYKEWEALLVEPPKGSSWEVSFGDREVTVSKGVKVVPTTEIEEAIKKLPIDDLFTANLDLGELTALMLKRGLFKFLVEDEQKLEMFKRKIKEVTLLATSPATASPANASLIAASLANIPTPLTTPFPLSATTAPIRLWRRRIRPRKL